MQSRGEELNKKMKKNMFKKQQIKGEENSLYLKITIVPVTTKVYIKKMGL